MNTTFTLLIISSEGTRRVVLGDGPTKVGRDPSADILISDPAISRHQLTLLRKGDHVLCEMNPQSRYQAVKNGRPAMKLELYSGERFELGPYKFELCAEVELPKAQRGPLDEDPGGPVDLEQARGVDRFAPRWRAQTEAPGTTATAATTAASGPQAPEVVPRWRKIALPAGVLLVVGFLGYDVLKPEAPGPAQAAQQQEPPPDLLESVQPIDCQGAEACLKRARDLYQVGVKLADSGTRDLLTLYKSAKQLHLARLALGKDVAKIPDLAQRADRSRELLRTELSDQWFRYQRVAKEGQLAPQLESLRTLLTVCREDRHRFCQGFELTAKRVEEQLTAARTDAAQRLADAERLAQQMIEEAKGRASEEGAKIIAAAKAEAEQEAVKAREALREQVAALAVKGAEQILRKEVNAGVHADLLSRLKTEL